MTKKIFFCLTLLYFFTQSLSVVHAAPCGWDGHQCAGYCTSGTCTGVGDTCICWPPPTNTPSPRPTNTPTPRPEPPCHFDSRADVCTGKCNPGYKCTGAGDSCGCVLISTPTPGSGGPTPTSPPCDVDGNNICNNSNPDCQSQCKPCDPDYTGPKKKYGNCYTSTTCRRNNLGPCYVYDDLPDPVHCGYCPSSGSTPTPFCQPYRCYDMNTPECPYSHFQNCSGGVGHCDNCGGVDCGFCSGHSPPGSTPAPSAPPDCVADCINPNVSPCIATTCSTQTCQGNCGQYCYGTLLNDCSCADNVCVGQTCIGTCGGECPGTKPNDCSCATNLCSDQTCQGSCGECSGQLTCVTPTLDSFEIRRSDWSYTDRDTGGSDIMDGDNRIHICDPFIANSSNPRRLIYVAWVSTSNGWQDIASVQIRWLRDYVPRNMVRITRFHDGDPANDELPNNRDVYYLIVDFDDSHNHTGNAYDHQINITSVAGSRSTGWLNADRLLKVWDCHVSAQGGFFDSAGQPACTMNTPMPAGMVNALAFGVGSSTVPTNITGAGYSVPNLHFAKSYLPYFNGGNAANIYGTLAVTSHATKVNNASGCISGNSLRVNEPGYGVDPYDDNTHQLQVDFAFSRIMDPWYQIIGSGLRTRVDLNWAVPATAPAASRFLTMSNPSLELDHGSVFYGDRSLNSNGYNGAYSPVPNWHAQSTLGRRSLYNYSYLYNRLFEARGIGTTGTAWNHKPATGPFFVNGDLLINQNNSAFAGQPLLTIVSGNLTVSPTVTQLHGLFMVDGNLDIGGSSTTPLTLTGSVYTRGNARLHRSLVPNASNNSNPAVIFRYQPGYMLNLPPDITKVLSGWRAE